MISLWSGPLTTRLRIISGLILFAYALTHFWIIGLGLFSADIMNNAQAGRIWFTRSLLGSVLIYGALFIHAGLAIVNLAGRGTIRMSWAEAAQIMMGLAIPLMLIAHIVHTRVAHQVYDVNDQMGYIMVLLYGHIDAFKQSGLLLLVWVHGCFGLHMWLRSRAWWRRMIPALVGCAVLLPAFALAGFLVEGRRLTALFTDAAERDQLIQKFNWPDRDMFVWLIQLTEWLLIGFFALLGIVALIYLARRFLRKRNSVRITYVGGPQIDAPKGHTLLEMSRSHGVPHTALCGGRGRCTTCRVVVQNGLELIAPPSPAEAKSLKAAGAAPNMRLACQIRPTHPTTVFRVFQPDGARHRAHSSQGKEKELAILFLDMRGFTARTTGQLPYDVVFLLNRFFDAIVPAVTGAGGTIDKYLGDGFLAVFETKTAESSAKSALQAVEDIATALIAFNKVLESEGQGPVRIGIGAHMGNVVLGEIGAQGQSPRTLIGDAVNTTSRLEGATKEHQVQAFISAPLLSVAGFDISKQHMVNLVLRGVADPLPALPIYIETDLPTHLVALQAKNRMGVI
jgi:adenylate cyclase